ncbi:MAG: hypothetical protein A3C85_00910 [Candidatus Doudnabacteria bacterium RIFCSPHIGHO2_02_FULL_48_21]|uniref:Uncharacterized protein n=1 Tax=Candidatus Doudnabacteria bacterium RIFCSPLOWO2_02_FULL_48_13 TaxID=1817845 RepID=A0A1F5Q895_9BACT|nr:MAG: hypothetical protein A3K05_04680 [Candidatus Doudnabacteria bacterium RIFCSPHIGHO2_01_48_18]OGE79871.1 MAG: hypothetical protein A2668_04610 [Candidatus Doudnabacteria bacterium RIFCSPHIGHO2_01_FULL_48_180]OGE91048.1 MAG: hypothetical protein A3F44_01845 [Candidatus Doudnabacteria bacterium RIFCSPHIGHO2_12_FULL_47_25]OGE94034.1 MAG: hypothetical protein A3C85_00910 [Candidatus Doudnabacteria bacterium RIFCSPHIGHO2_02_FULL_48_21]OGE98046.1 MAG: hypothetical protein A3A83_03575 [Candidatu
MSSPALVPVKALTIESLFGNLNHEEGDLFHAISDRAEQIRVLEDKHAALVMHNEDAIRAFEDIRKGKTPSFQLRASIVEGRYRLTVDDGMGVPLRLSY